MRCTSSQQCRPDRFGRARAASCLTASSNRTCRTWTSLHSREFQLTDDCQRLALMHHGNKGVGHEHAGEIEQIGRLLGRSIKKAERGGFTFHHFETNYNTPLYRTRCHASIETNIGLMKPFLLYPLLILSMLLSSCSKPEHAIATQQQQQPASTYFPVQLGEKTLFLQLALHQAERSKGLSIGKVWIPTTACCSCLKMSVHAPLVRNTHSARPRLPGCQRHCSSFISSIPTMKSVSLPTRRKLS